MHRASCRACHYPVISTGRNKSLAQWPRHLSLACLLAFMRPRDLLTSTFHSSGSECAYGPEVAPVKYYVTIGTGSYLPIRQGDGFPAPGYYTLSLLENPKHRVSA